MSATGRTGGKKIPLENYPTPEWSVQRWVEHAKRAGIPLHGNLLEPMAGDGVIIRVIGIPGADGRANLGNWEAVEIRSECSFSLAEAGAAYVHTCDIFAYLASLDPVGRMHWDHSVTNPAFTKAFRLVKALYPHSAWITLLLRLNWLEGGKDELEGSERSAWLAHNMPDVAILPNRPPFARSQKTGKIGTDATSYAWMTWGPHSRGATKGSVTLLDRTPADVRRAHVAKLAALP